MSIHHYKGLINTSPKSEKSLIASLFVDLEKCNIHITDRICELLKKTPIEIGRSILRAHAILEKQKMPVSEPLFELMIVTIRQMNEAMFKALVKLADQKIPIDAEQLCGLLKERPHHAEKIARVLLLLAGRTTTAALLTGLKEEQWFTPKSDAERVESLLRPREAAATSMLQRVPRAAAAVATYAWRRLFSTTRPQSGGAPTSADKPPSPSS